MQIEDHESNTDKINRNLAGFGTSEVIVKRLSLQRVKKRLNLLHRFLVLLRACGWFLGRGFGDRFQSHLLKSDQVVLLQQVLLGKYFLSFCIFGYFRQAFDKCYSFYLLQKYGIYAKIYLWYGCQKIAINYG